MHIWGSVGRKLKALGEWGRTFQGLSALLLAVIGTISAVMAIARWLTPWGVERMWVPHWVIAGGTVLVIVACIVLLWQFLDALLSHAKRPFQTFNVYVTDCDHFWRLNKSPVDWIDIDLSKCGPEYSNSLISGPYHSLKGCAAYLAHKRNVAGVPALLVYGDCERCGSVTALKRIIDSFGDDISFIPQSILQQEVLSELQRLHRIGKKIQDGLKIQLNLEDMDS